MKKLIKSLLFVNLIIMSFFLLSCSKKDNNKENPPLGTWWWNKNLNMAEYLDFANYNNITEIYFCDYSLSDNTKELLKKAKKYKIKI